MAQSYGRSHVKTGDEVVVIELEHHSNLVPWQMPCAERGARLRMLPIDEREPVQLNQLGDLLVPRTKIVAVSHVSNSLGTVLPVKETCSMVRIAGAISVVDGALAGPHRCVDVGSIGGDSAFFRHTKCRSPRAPVCFRDGVRCVRRCRRGRAGGTGSSPSAFPSPRPIFTCRIASKPERPTSRPSSEWARPSTGFGRSASIAGRRTRKAPSSVVEHFGIDGTIRASLGIHTTDDEPDCSSVVLSKDVSLLG